MSGNSEFCPIQRLHEDNYEIWQYEAKILLRSIDHWSIVENESPDKSAARYSKWKKKDKKALSDITFLVEESQLVHIADASTAKEAWDALKNYHQNRLLSRKFNLMKKLFQLRLDEDGVMRDYIFEFKTTLTKLRDIGQTFDEESMSSMLLAGLPPSYDVLVQKLVSSSKNDFTLEFLKGKLLDEHRRQRTEKIEAEEKNLSESELKERRETVNCKGFFPCKQDGHLRRDCEVLDYICRRCLIIDERPIDYYED